jgi:hypothetical protein
MLSFESLVLVIAIGISMLLRALALSKDNLTAAHIGTFEMFTFKL